MCLGRNAGVLRVFAGSGAFGGTVRGGTLFPVKSIMFWEEWGPGMLDIAGGQGMEGRQAGFAGAGRARAYGAARGRGAPGQGSGDNILFISRWRGLGGLQRGAPDDAILLLAVAGRILLGRCHLSRPGGLRLGAFGRRESRRPLQRRRGRRAGSPFRRMTAAG